MGSLPSWVAGVLLSVTGCTLSNFGVNLQKLSHTKVSALNRGLPKGARRSVLTHPIWIIGISMVIVGSIADLVSFGFADMSLLAPLGAMTLVVSACASRLSRSCVAPVPHTFPLCALRVCPAPALLLFLTLSLSLPGTHTFLLIR
jgi:hypothetical protein